MRSVSVGTGPLLEASPPKHAFYPAGAMYNRENLERFGVGLVRDEVGVDGEEENVGLRKVGTPMTLARLGGQGYEFFEELSLNAVGDAFTVAGDIDPNLKQV